MIVWNVCIPPFADESDSFGYPPMSFSSSRWMISSLLLFVGTLGLILIGAGCTSERLSPEALYARAQEADALGRGMQELEAKLEINLEAMKALFPKKYESIPELSS